VGKTPARAQSEAEVREEAMGILDAFFPEGFPGRKEMQTVVDDVFKTQKPSGKKAEAKD